MAYCQGLKNVLSKSVIIAIDNKNVKLIVEIKNNNLNTKHSVYILLLLQLVIYGNATFFNAERATCTNSAIVSCIFLQLTVFFRN